MVEAVSMSGENISKEALRRLHEVKSGEAQVFSEKRFFRILKEEGINVDSI